MLHRKQSGLCYSIIYSDNRVGKLNLNVKVNDKPWGFESLLGYEPEWRNWQTLKGLINLRLFPRDSLLLWPPNQCVPAMLVGDIGSNPVGPAIYGGCSSEVERPQLNSHGTLNAVGGITQHKTAGGNGYFPPATYSRDRRRMKRCEA